MLLVSVILTIVSFLCACTPTTLVISCPLIFRIFNSQRLVFRGRTVTSTRNVLYLPTPSQRETGVDLGLDGVRMTPASGVVESNRIVPAAPLCSRFSLPVLTQLRFAGDRLQQLLTPLCVSAKDHRSGVGWKPDGWMASGLHCLTTLNLMPEVDRFTNGACLAYLLIYRHDFHLSVAGVASYIHYQLPFIVLLPVSNIFAHSGL